MLCPVPVTVWSRKLRPDEWTGTLRQDSTLGFSLRRDALYGFSSSSASRTFREARHRIALLNIPDLHISLSLLNYAAVQNHELLEIHPKPGVPRK